MTEPDPKRYIRRAPRPPEGTIDLESLFPEPGPIELDVGFGRGLSLFRRHEVAPDSNILGVEIKPKVTCWAAEKAAKLEIDRIVAWAADIRTLLPQLGPEASITRAFLHFPDPWWKKRHRKKRQVLTQSFLLELARLLKNDGELLVQTDVEDRAHDYFQECDQAEDFQTPTWIEANPYGSVSNRERRAEEDGLPIYRFIVKRTDR